MTGQYVSPPRRGLRRVLVPYVLLYVALLLLAAAAGIVAGNEIARAIGGSRHIGEALGFVAALYVVRRIYVVLTKRLIARYLGSRRMYR